MNPLPTGTVTFLFTDIEGSTQLWEKHPEAMKAALARHDAILRESIAAHGGHYVKTTGDGVLAAFEQPSDCIRAMLAAQDGLLGPLEGIPIRVRMGAHTGEAELRGDDYYGQTLNRAARLMAAGHGGQMLVSHAMAELVRGSLPPGASLRDLGEHRLRDIGSPERIFQVCAPPLQSEFPPLVTPDSFPNNLPLQLTSFIGREREIAELGQAIADHRLVTLTGSGGTGKTRLAQEVGGQLLSDFGDGVWLVELAPLSDPAQIIPALAQVFGLEALPFSPLATLVMDYMRDKQLLLLLDNCEHLTVACARLADDLLHQCAGLKILASSREALGIAGELAYHVPSLADAESSQLFVARAQAANSDFRPTEANAAAIAQICRRLDGIPLAIELAAARVRLLSPEQIVSRLDDRFRLLVGGSRTALPRQQTLRALIDWSYGLLSDEEKRLLHFASVFVGGWTLDALEAVADDPGALEHLDGLVNKSLVVTEARPGEMRYFMLETIRQYAREKLFEAGQAPAGRDRHFFYFAGLSEQLWEAFRSSDMHSLRDRADDEVENFRAALDWGLENHAEETLRLAANFCVVCSWTGNPGEGLAAVETALKRAESLPPVKGEAQVRRQRLIAWALFSSGMVGMGVGNMPLVQQELREAIAISRTTGERRTLGYSLEMYFTATRFMAAPGGEEAAREGLEIFSRELDDQFGLGMAYLNMARVASARGDESEKQRYFGKVEELTKDKPVSFQLGLYFMAMGADESEHGHYEMAESLLEEALRAFDRVRSANFQLVTRSELGHLARRTGDMDRARTIYKETIRGWQQRGNRAAVAHQLECFGFLALGAEQPGRTVKLFGAAEALREKVESPMTDQERTEYDKALAQLHALLTQAEFEALRAEGRALPLEQAVRLALDEG